MPEKSLFDPRGGVEAHVEAGRRPVEAKESAERSSTDASLDQERSRTDGELAKHGANLAEDADAAVVVARDQADAVLQAAREVADHPLPNHQAGLASERKRDREDAVVSSQRAEEDQSLEAGRLARSEALTELFRLERDQTDLYLLTERARADEALNTRDTFLAMVAHDLRTMLQGITLAAGMLTKEDAPEKGSVRKRAEVIQRLSSRMTRLIGDLVDVATVENGRQLVTPAGGDLLRLLRETSEGLKPVAASHGIALVCEVLGAPRVGAFDHDRILQVLANLVSNAIKFTPPSGKIVLRVEAQEGGVLFSVRDTGTGIPPDKLEMIFERFWQVGQNDRRGLGLGLYISKCIVQGHGGRIWAECAPGSGATLFFTLPALPKEPRPEKAR